MQIRFETKEESNARREREFMALTPSQRFQSFMELCWALSNFESRSQEEDKGNFVLTLK